MAGGCTHGATGVRAQCKVAQAAGYGRGRARGGAARDAIGCSTVDGRTKVGVVAVHGKGQLIRDGLACQRRTCVEQLLHGGRGLRLDARHGQHQRVAAACRVASNVKQVFNAEVQAAQWPGAGMGHGHIRIGNKGMGGVVQGHRYFRETTGGKKAELSKSELPAFVSTRFQIKN